MITVVIVTIPNSWCKIMEWTGIKACEMEFEKLIINLEILEEMASE